MKRSALDMYGLLSVLSLTRKSTYLELTPALANEPSIIASIVKVNVTVPSSTINTVMTLLGSKVDMI